ncbi:MAG: hypothetical protein J4N94_06645 [Chloroflexi bacterium]|nr:hypothetical protein [Chloroflexota bacterium]
MELRDVRICIVFGHGRVTGMTGMIVSLSAVGKPVDLPFLPDEPSSMIHAEDAAQIFMGVALA